MKFKKEVLLLIFIILLITFVSADDGCCREKSPGVYCQNNVLEGSCSSASEGADGWSPSSCEETTFCAPGCCVSDDGICSANTGLATCTANSATWESDTTCAIDECQKGCCQLGDEFSFTTFTNCEAKYESYEEGPTWNDGVTSEEACNLYNSLDEFGCCVSDNGCTFVSRQECLDELGDISTDIETGEGYYQGQSCAAIQAELASGDYTASCDCEYTTDGCTIDHKIYETNTCGDIILTEDSCIYPEKACDIDSDGEAYCRSTECANTFKYDTTKTITQDLEDSANFETFNSYTVYNSASDKFESYALGGTKDNGASWCVFEGPTGSFKDRIGTQHYVAHCYDGEEIWENCGEKREEYCAMLFDDNGDPVARCIPNNFEEYYSYPYHEGHWGHGEVPDYNEIGGGNEYQNRFPEFYGEIDTPIEAEGNSGDPFGVSTVALASEEYCPHASITCDLGYWDYGGNQDFYLHTNSICLRSEFIANAIDYCGSRGDCGINLNILGEKGQEDQFDLTYGEAELAGKYKIGLGRGCKSGGNYFSWITEIPLLEDTSQIYALNYLYEGILMGWYGYSLIPLGILEINYGTCIKIQDPNVERYYTNILKPKNNADLEMNTINDNLLSDYMFSTFLPLTRLYLYTTGNYDYTAQNQLAKHLGTNYQGASNTNFDKERIKEIITDIQEVYYSGRASYLGGEVYSIKNEFTALDGCDENSLISGNKICNEDGFEISKKYQLYNQLKSIKPWIMDTRALQSSSISGPINEKAGTHFTIYPFGWEETTDESGGQHIVGRMQYTCKEWKAPSGDDNCHLCDLPSEEGGLWFSQDGVRIQAAACTKTKCESLGSNCKFIDGNAGSATKASCVSELCDFEIPILKAYEETILESTSNSELIIDINTDFGGYEATNLPPGQMISFGVKTENIISQCKFIEKETFQAVLDETDGANTYGELAQVYPDQEDFYKLFSGRAGVFDTPQESSCSEAECIEGHDYKHNISMVFSNGQIREFYVMCKNLCDDYFTGQYSMYLEASADDPTTYSGTYTHFIPPTNTYIAATEDTVEVYLYTDIQVTCKYDTSQIDSYDIAENEMDFCTQPSANIINGNFYCRSEIPITEGTNTFSFLCRDQYGNDMSSTQSWTVIKSDPLLISQTSPTGTQSYSDILLEVRTQAGAESGKATCYYKQDYQYGYDTMLNSYEDDSYWTQSQTLGEGDYIYDIYCEDVAGNKNETTISFTMDVDEYAPEITRLYSLSGTLYVVTNEETTCEYDSSSFTYGSGFSLTGIATTDHSVTITEEIDNYHIICQDEFGNQNTPFVVNLDYLS